MNFLKNKKHHKKIEEKTDIVENQELRSEVKVGIDKTYIVIGIVIFILLSVMIKKIKLE